MAFEGLESDLTNEMMGAYFAVYNSLGYGFLEKVYENAIALELRKRGLQVETQKPLRVFYGGQVVGEYVADIVVNGKVLIELKAVRQILVEHEAQLLNYLKATPIEVGLLFNFGPKADYRRRVYSNERKGSLEWVEQPHNS